MKRILILGCGGTAAVNFIKCLRQNVKGIPMKDMGGPAMYSEPFYIVGTDLNEYQLEAANVDYQVLEYVDKKDFTTWINNLIKAHSIDFVYAAPDIWVKRLGQRRDEINAKTFLPSNLALARCQDKYVTYTTLRDAGVPVPETYPVNTDISSIFFKLNEDKVWVRAREGAGSKCALPCETEEQIKNWIHYHQDMKNMFPANFIVSEFLPGPEYAAQLVYKKGLIGNTHNGLVSYFGRERLEYVFGHLMPSGQSSSPSVARTSYGPPDQNIVEIAARAVCAVDPEPNGVYGVDMKTGADGEIKVTEINAGRFYTTSDFSAAVGVNLPYNLIKLAFDEDAENQRTPKGEHYWIRSMDREPFLWTKK